MRKVTSDGGAYFPQSYLTDMFQFFERNKDKLEIITYQDLCWDDDLEYLRGYPQEKKRWLEGLKNGEIDSDKAYILLQYDLDSRPERAMSLLKHESHSTIPANIMLFARRVDRRLLKTTDQLEYTEYKLDDALLKSLESKGFLIGYHSNCYERSHHNKQTAPEILDTDIKLLKEAYNIDFYTAHGGVPCKDGKNNRDIRPLESTSRDVRWVHNGASPFFNKQFSDGGHNSPLRDPADRDIRDFVSNIKPGGRYRILVHPQYYDTSFSPSKRYSGTSWYDEMLTMIDESKDYDSWGNIKLTNFVSAENSVSPVLKQQGKVNSFIADFSLRELAKRIFLYIRR